MSPGKWPRSAVACLANERATTTYNLAVTSLATTSIALLVFSCDFNNILSEVMHKDRAPKSLFDGTGYRDNFDREAAGYAEFLGHFFKKAASMAGTPAAAMTASIANNLLWAATTSLARGPVRQVRQKEVNRASVISTTLSITLGCFASSRMGRLPPSNGVPHEFTTLMCCLGSHKSAFRLSSQTKLYPFLSSTMEEKSDQLIRYMANRAYAAPQDSHGVMSRTNFYTKSLMSVLMLARRRKHKSHATSSSLFTAAKMIANESTAISSSSNNSSSSSSSSLPTSTKPRQMTKLPALPAEGDGEPPRKVILVSPSGPPETTAAMHGTRWGPRICHNCSAFPKPLPCKGSWRDRSGARTKCANAPESPPH